MTRKPLILANWKMNLGLAESIKLARAIQRKRISVRGACDLVLLPSYGALVGVRQAIRGGKIQLGAQDIFWAESGNYTGEVSPGQIREIGCTWTLIGHSERREHLNETDEMVGRKLSAALRHGLTPVVCVGETRDQRNERKSELIVQKQIHEAFRYVRPPFSGQRIIIAYEPRWAISPGRPCNPDDAKAMAVVIRQALVDQYDSDQFMGNFTIIYGGSVDASNLGSYLANRAFDGALVGKASLTTAELFPLLDAVSAFIKPAPIKLKKS